MPKYPNITARPKDGNAFSILGAVVDALRKNKVSEEEVVQFLKEAKSGNYDHLLTTAINTVNLEPEEEEEEQDCYEDYGYNQDDDLPECEDDEE